MTARSKSAVQTAIRTKSALFARNRQDLTRVLVSYRTLSQRWAFRPSWAVAMTLIQTAKLNGVEPTAWLTDVLECVVSGRTKAHELHSLLPWNWRATSDADRPATA